MGALFIKSQCYRPTWVRRDLEDHPVPPSPSPPHCWRQCCQLLNQVAQCPIRLDLEHFQWLDTKNTSKWLMRNKKENAFLAALFFFFPPQLVHQMLPQSHSEEEGEAALAGCFQAAPMFTISYMAFLAELLHEHASVLCLK